MDVPKNVKEFLSQPENRTKMTDMLNTLVCFVRDKKQDGKGTFVLLRTEDGGKQRMDNIELCIIVETDSPDGETKHKIVIGYPMHNVLIDAFADRKYDVDEDRKIDFDKCSKAVEKNPEVLFDNIERACIHHADVIFRLIDCMIASDEDGVAEIAKYEIGLHNGEVEEDINSETDEEGGEVISKKIYRKKESNEAREFPSPELMKKKKKVVAGNEVKLIKKKSKEVDLLDELDSFLNKKK